MGILNKIRKGKTKGTSEKAGGEVAIEKKEERKKVESGKQAPIFMKHDIFVRPHVSEKSVVHESAGVYTFVVKRDATKLRVKQAIAAIYGVTPTDVRMINVEGKRQMRGRVAGKRTDWKKALVTLPKGKTISIHEGV